MVLLLEEAMTLGEIEPDSAVLASVGLDALPSARTVTFQLQDTALVFFVGDSTAKARDLREQPNVSLCVHWKQARMQVAIDGEAGELSQADADSAWRLRSRESQVAAQALAECTESGDTLRKKVRELSRRFEGQEIARPDSWSGYAIEPRRVAIWHTGWDRVRLREVYVAKAAGHFELEYQRP